MGNQKERAIKLLRTSLAMREADDADTWPRANCSKSGRPSTKTSPVKTLPLPRSEPRDLLKPYPFGRATR